MVKQIQKRLVTAIFLLIVAPFLSAQEQADSLVRLISASYIEQIESKDGQLIRKAVDATFLHNGTTLICDSAFWHTNDEIINCIGNVRLIQGETQLTSDKLDYLIKEDLAQFRGAVVQLRNAQDNLLRTRILDYNTKDSVAVFSSGAAMRSEDGQVIESDEGHYFNAQELFTFRGNVNMYADSTFIRTTALDYDSARDIAHFNEYVDFWRDDNMLSADKGWYKRVEELFFFEGKVHGLTPTQESWSDSLYYYRALNDVLMQGAAQVQDTTRSVISLSDKLFYRDSLSTLTLNSNAAIAIWSENEGQIDTTYMGADTIIYRAVRKCDIPQGGYDAAEQRKKGFEGDPVSELRRRAAEEAAKRKEEAERENRPRGAVDPKKAAEEADGSIAPEAADSLAAAAAVDTVGVAKDSLAMGADSLRATEDTLAIGTDALRAEADSLQVADSVGVGIDSLGVGVDSLAFSADSLELSDSLRLGLDSLAVARADSIARADSLANLDTTRIGFITGVGNVKVFRKTMQVRCDSLEFCELDSIARFYRSPLVWNEQTHQYSADSLFVRMTPKGVDKAYLITNAFIAIQEDTSHYDQIKSLEVMAYFDENAELSRFDALGGATALFYLTENEALSTVNRVEAKMLSASFAQGEIDRIYYFENPKNDAYPIVQLPENEQTLKGLEWQIEKRPQSRHDISTLEVKPSQRLRYSSRPRAKFVQTDKYFPGYIADLHNQLELAKIRKQQRADSAAVASDSLELSDSLAVGLDSLISDSLSVDSLAVAADSLSVADTTATQEEEWQSPAELRRALRQARRDARWAELDKRDAEREAAKAAKAEARRKRREERLAKRKALQEAKEAALLQYYIDFYTKQKAKEDAARGVIDNGLQSQI